MMNIFQKILLIVLFFPIFGLGLQTQAQTLCDSNMTYTVGSQYQLEVAIPTTGNGLPIMAPLYAVTYGDGNMLAEDSCFSGPCTHQIYNYNPIGGMSYDTITTCISYTLTDSVGYIDTLMCCFNQYWDGQSWQREMMQQQNFSCDSVNISGIQLDVNMNEIYFDIITSDVGSAFPYCGFILLSSTGDTLAIQNSGNVYGLLSYDTETRSLDIIQNFNLPFTGELHLISNWFAGNQTTSCVFPVTINKNICEVEIDGDSITCFYNTTQILEASPTASSSLFSIYEWYSSTGQLLATGNQLTINSPGEYCVAASDSAGTCVDTSCIVISVQDIPIYTAPSPAIICLGDSIVMEIDSFWNDIVWSNGDTTDLVVAYPNNDITYVVEAFDSSGCEGRGEVIVNVDSCANNIIQAEYNSERIIIKIIDLLGRETKRNKNKLFIVIYSDGTFEKRIILE